MPTYQVLVYNDLDGDAELVPADTKPIQGDKISIPIYTIDPKPHPTLGHTFKLPPGLKERLCALQSPSSSA